MSTFFNGFWLVCKCWLTKLFNQLLPTPLCRFVVNQLNEDPVWEPWGQVASDYNVLVLPLLGGLAFRKHGVGGILWSRACLGSIKVAPAVHGQHGLLEMCSKGGPIRGIFFEMWDGVGEYKERHSECDDTLQQ